MQFTTLALTTLIAAVSGRSLNQRDTTTPNEARDLPCGTLVAPSSRALFSLNAAHNDQYVRFDLGPELAAGPGPCTLFAFFEADFPIVNVGEPQIRVVAGEGSNSPGSEVGSFRLDKPTPDGGRVINSFQCADVLSFDFSIENVEPNDRARFLSDGYNGLYIKVGDQC